MASSYLHGIGDADKRAVSQRSLNATVNDVSPIEAARARFLQIVADHFTAPMIQEIVEVPGCEADCSPLHESDKVRKRKSAGVRYEGDPQYACPVIYVANIYETLVNEVNVRLATLDGFQGKTIGVDLEAAGGLYKELARKFPDKGPLTFKRRELTSPADTRKWFPHLVVQEEKAVNFVVVNGLKIVKKPDTVSVADAEWFKRLTGRGEVSISAQDYKFYSLRGPSIPCLPKKELSSLPRASCSAKSMESKAQVKPPNIRETSTKPYVEEPYIQEPYIHVVPNFMVPYIIDFSDDFAFGHCGFEAIAVEVGLGKDAWRGVRRDLFLSLTIDEDHVYEQLFTSDTIKKILKALLVYTIPVTLPEQRFSFQEMGHIVASHYGVVFVVLGQQCVTFLPLYRNIPGDLLDLPEICLVHLHHQKRFISVTLDADFPSPLPPIHPLWHRLHDSDTDGLDRCYADHIQKFEWFQSFIDPPVLEKCD